MTESAEPSWSLPAVLDVVTAAVPDREMVVSTTLRRTYAQARARSRGLAAYFAAHGLGERKPKTECERWECGQSTVAIVLSNCVEYVETMIGAYRARAVPFNVNHHYHPAEIADLLERIEPAAIVYQRGLGAKLEDYTRRHRCLLLDVDDDSTAAPLPGSIEFESAVAAPVAGLPEPSPDDLYLICTGGTTGPPKGVLWRQDDIFVSGMGGVEGQSADEIAQRALRPPAIWFAPSPLMHAAGQRTVFAGILSGGTAVLHDDRLPFNAPAILATAERERVSIMSIVGDAYARPLVDELRRGRYDLSALARIGTGGATTSAELKAALVEMLPHLTVVDTYSSSETGAMAFAATQRGAVASTFRMGSDTAVLSADRSRLLGPADGEVGWAARCGRVPLGYLNDPTATGHTFPVVDGRRWAVPGDRARVGDDGNLILVGRDSLVINSGGEKIFVEEVEAALRRHPDVMDAVVVGRASERFGQEVVALVRTRPGATLTPRAVREFAARSIARFKAPRAVLWCDEIRRHASGKPDYSWARNAALDATPVE
jgi:fatty-acyl-CoA synthase